MQYKCLTIAGFDGSGGAGMQADLKTFTALGCYGMSVLTALPIQNTMGVTNCYNIPLECIDEQLHSIFSDIKPDCIKIGMVYSSEIIEVIYKHLSKHKNIPVICDPVMLAKDGSSLLKKEAIKSLKDLIFPLTTIVTPNIPEAEFLAGSKSFVLEKILDFGAYAVLLKGGHSLDDKCNDILLTKNSEKICFSSERIQSKNTHGTGCTLSAAICCYIAKGFSIEESCSKAKDYLLNALKYSKDISVGMGNGPVNHFYNILESS